MKNDAPHVQRLSKVSADDCPSGNAGRMGETAKREVRSQDSVVRMGAMKSEDWSQKSSAQRHSKVSESGGCDRAQPSRAEHSSAQRYSKVSEWGFYCSAVRIGRNVSEPPSQRECTTPEHPVQRLSNDSGWL